MPQVLGGELRRVVESQEQIATNRLVSSLEEQAVLESLLESSKPPLPSGCEKLHYLLGTPFRYPPLRHGSRFGSRFEPSLFYAARTTTTVIAEAAYYRLLFWHGMALPPAGGLTTQHTLFGARFKTRLGLRLHKKPFDAFVAQLADPADYRASQALGSALRGAGIDAFEFRSARDPAGGVNVALFHPAVLSVSRPLFSEGWLCETTASGVSFYCAETRQMLSHDIATFMVEGSLPMPAA